MKSINLKIPFVIALLVSNGLLFTADGSLPRVVGAMTLLLLPGLAWSEYLLPYANRLTRWLIGAGLSYTLVIILGLILTYWPGPITLSAQLIVLNTLILLPLLGRKIFRHSGEQAFKASNPHWHVAILLTILIVAALFRFANLGYSEFQGDEGEVMIPVAEALEGNQAALFTARNKGPAEVLLPMVLWRLTGTLNELIARLPFAIAGLLMVLTIYLLGRELLGEHVGLIAAGLFALNGFMLAFSRIVQYQTIVVWMSTLALLCLWEWHKDGRSLWPVLAATFIGVGLLAHYDTILVIPALGYLTLISFKSPGSKATSLISHFGSWLPAAGLLLIITGLFYIPYILNPQLTDTQSYLNGRIGQGGLQNSLAHFLHYNIFYNSFYYLFVTGMLLLGFLASTLPHSPLIKRIPTSRYWLPALAVSLILGLTFRPEALHISPGLDLTVLPFALLLLGAFLSSALNPAQRVIVVWLAIPFLGYNFVVANPKTHIYTIVPAWTLLAGLAAARVWQFHISKPKSLLLAACALLLAVLFSSYLYLAYLRQDVEYVTDWPAGQLALFWAPVPYNDLPPGDFFGFVHRTGWKAVGGLYATGKLNGSYYSNEKESVTWWYTRNALRKKAEEPPIDCRLQPDYYIVAAKSDDNRKIDYPKIETYYSLIGQGTLPTGNGITIYEVNPSTNELGQHLDMGILARAFDRAAKPAAFIRPPPQSSELSTNFNNLIQLLGYDLDTHYAHPGGRIIVTLHWKAQAQIPADLQVFVHLEAEDTGNVLGQSNSRPVCGLFSTLQWPPGQEIPDQHIININPHTPPGNYRISVGMYHPATAERLAIFNQSGNPVGNSTKLTTILIQE